MRGNFKFDRLAHIYTLDDVRLPSVTEVLADLYDYDGVSRIVLLDAGKRGRYVHEATELCDKDDLDWDSLEPAYIPYIQAWLKFRDEQKPQLIDAEVSDYHRRLMYAGTRDRVLVLNGALTLVDIKTTYKVNRVDALQTAGYAALHDQHANLRGEIERRCSIQLRMNGTYVLQDWTDKKDFAVFRSCLFRHQWRQAA